MELVPVTYRPAINPPGQRHIARLWVAHLEAQAGAGMLAERTAAAYATHGGTWLEWLELAGIETPMPADVLRWVADLRAEGRKPATVNAKLAAVKALYVWAETSHLYPAIARSVRSVPQRRDEPLDCLTPSQVAGLLGLVDGAAISVLRDRAILHVLFSTACRLSSLQGADVADLDRETGELTYKAKGDRDKARIAYLSRGALAAVLDYLAARKADGETLAADKPLFIAQGNRAGGGRLSIRSIRRVVVGLMERAGHAVRDAEGHIRRPGVFSAHSLRRSAVTAAADAVGIEAAQTLAGHADARTTRRAYARVQRGRVLRELAGVLDLSTLNA